MNGKTEILKIWEGLGRVLAQKIDFYEKIVIFYVFFRFLNKQKIRLAGQILKYFSGSYYCDMQHPLRKFYVEHVSVRGKIFKNMTKKHEKIEKYRNFKI